MFTSQRRAGSQAVRAPFLPMELEMKVLACDGIHEDGLALFRDAGWDVVVAPEPIKDPQALASALAGLAPSAIQPTRSSNTRGRSSQATSAIYFLHGRNAVSPGEVPRSSRLYAVRIGGRNSAKLKPRLDFLTPTRRKRRRTGTTSASPRPPPATA